MEVIPCLEAYPFLVGSPYHVDEVGIPFLSSACPDQADAGGSLGLSQVGNPFAVAYLLEAYPWVAYLCVAYLWEAYLCVASPSCLYLWASCLSVAGSLWEAVTLCPSGVGEAPWGA